jgi:hypothetical protein
MEAIKTYLKAKMSEQGFVNISKATIETRTNTVCIMSAASDLGYEIGEVDKQAAFVICKVI